MKHFALAGENREACRLCAILGKGAAVDAFDSVWLADERYKALISVGAMVPGWTLVCPVEHAVNLKSHYGNASFHEFVEAASEYIQQRYGACVVFEHGAKCEDSATGCGVGHAHLHLVPLSAPLEMDALRSAPILAWRPCSMLEIPIIAGDSEYLFVADAYTGPSTHGLLAKLDAPVSQFFRRLIANRLGMGEFFDYKKYPMLDIARASAETLRAAVTQKSGA